MTDLMNVLAPPKKAKAPTDPNQKILKRLARNGWNQNGRGTKTVLVREHDGFVYLTNTYAMRRFPIASAVADAVRSVVPDCHDAASVMADGFELGLTAGDGGSWIENGRTCPDMANVWPTAVPDHEIVSWEANVDDAATVFGHTTDGVRVKLNTKFVKAVTDGVDDARVFAAIADDGEIRKPVAFVSDGLIVGILMPLRQW